MVEARAILKGIRISPRKARLVADLVRGRSVEQAVALLAHLPKKGAPIFSKLILSAAANARTISGGEVDVDRLRIKTVFVDGGKVLKRWMPRAMGRATPIKKRTSHITVVVSSGE